MRTFTFFIIILLLLGPVSNSMSASQGDSAPDFSMISSEGDVTSLAKHKGKTLLLIFWRTGQKRSLLALKDANELLKKYGRKGVDIISVIEDSDNIEDARKIISENSINIPIFIDKEREAYGDFGVRVFPTTMIIDKEGILAFSMPSHPLTYKTKLQGYIRKVLGEIDEKELASVLSPKKEVKDESTLEATRKYNLALKFIQMRLPDQAIDAALQSVEARPDMVKSLVLLGFLYLNEDEADKALDAFEKALKIEPDSNDARTGKGGALVLIGEADKAIEILNKAANANPYPQMTYYELGKAYELKGDKDKAVAMYKKAIDKIIHKKILPSSVSKCQ